MPASERTNFVSASVLTKQPPTRREILRGMLRHAPFVAKNFRLYFQNAWRQHILRTDVVAPYAVTFYVTHKCNLDCSYCTQKEPDIFSAELPTAETKRLLRRIRKETDSIVITGGEPTLRPDIEELVGWARYECKFRSLLLITNGTLLDRKPLEIGSQTAHWHRDDAQRPMKMARDGLRLLPLTRAITLKFERVGVNLLPDFLASNAG